MTSKKIAVLGLALVAMVSVAQASELDETTSPRALLVRTSESGETVVYSADRVVAEGSEGLEQAIAAVAVDANVIAQIERVQADASELDREPSTSAWYWWGYGSYWNYGYSGWNYGWNNTWFTYSNYSYYYRYPCYYGGYRWSWFW